MKPAGKSRLELNLAKVLRVNALAVPYRGRLLMDLVQREMALVMSLFGPTPPGQPLRRHRAFDGSSLHIRRFATEVLALGALTAIVQREQSELTDVAHFDALRPELKKTYPSSGTRPDLRFAGADQLLAGESRGRSYRPPIRSLTAPQQRKRLRELLAWSRQPGCDPVCMAWSWMQSEQTTVDFFRFTKDTSAPRTEVGLVEQLERAADVGRSARPADDEGLVSASEGDVPRDFERAAPGFTHDRTRERSAKQRIIRRTIEDREEQLLESAPPQQVPGMRPKWFGRWQTVPGIDYGDGPRLLLAISRAAGTRGTDSAEPDNQLLRSREMGIEVSAAGRVVVAIDWRKRSEPDAGDAVQQVLNPAEM
ncbi:hypothetical protein ABZ744_20700 [Micromonospora chersina]|uniref:hypothetical protein n=1 Tax=Micromonospora chersina TaxID=47854 RepID=UPI0034042FE6